MITGRLGYNSANDRYGLLVSDLWEHDGISLRRSLGGYGRLINGRN